MVRVWYHARCKDGFGAALVLWWRHGADAAYVAVSYGDEIPEWNPGDEIWIVDFWFEGRGADIRRMAGLADVTVIDHHETVEAELRELPFAFFDKGRSGAVATWQHLHDAPVPELLLYVQDRDLWRWELPDSRAVSCALENAERSFEVWSTLSIEDLKRDGRAMLRSVEATVEGMAARAWRTSFFGHDVLVANSSCHASELGHVLASRSPSGIGIVWHYDGTKVTWELRSLADGPDVGELAKKCGGGGHRHASGFRTERIDRILRL